jgi:uncharacterized membrane protein
VHPELPLTNEIYTRMPPNLMDLRIALAGGGAGAFAMIRPHLNLSAVGVAISTALAPPFSASAICLTRGEYRLSIFDPQESRRITVSLVMCSYCGTR